MKHRKYAQYVYRIGTRSILSGSTGKEAMGEIERCALTTLGSIERTKRKSWRSPLQTPKITKILLVSLMPYKRQTYIFNPLVEEVLNPGDSAGDVDDVREVSGRDEIEVEAEDIERGAEDLYLVLGEVGDLALVLFVAGITEGNDAPDLALDG